jgi:hypothetical protein
MVMDLSHPQVSLCPLLHQPRTPSCLSRSQNSSIILALPHSTGLSPPHLLLERTDRVNTLGRTHLRKPAWPGSHILHLDCMDHSKCRLTFLAAYALQHWKRALSPGFTSSPCASHTRWIIATHAWRECVVLGVKSHNAA